MPAMAAPFVVKVPLAANTSEIQPHVSQSSLSVHPCDSTNPYHCANWCSVCGVDVSSKCRSSPAKKYCNQTTHETSHPSNSPALRNLGKSLKTSKISSPDREFKKNTGTVCKKLPPLPSNDNNSNEKYIRDTERVLRGKLRDLKCTPVQRQLPEVPCKEICSRNENRPISQSVVKALHSVAEASKQTSIDSKRLRHVSDLDHSFSLGHVFNAPKRPRDVSPKTKSVQEGGAAGDGARSTLVLKKEAWSDTSDLPGAGGGGVGAVGCKSVPSGCCTTPGLLLQKDGSEHPPSQTHNSDSSSNSDEEDDYDLLEKRTTVHHPRHNNFELLRHLTIVKNEDYKLHPSLRASLFAHIPPFIKFVSDTVKAERALPVVVQKTLKWKLTTITPIIVKKVVQNSGFKFTRRTPDWVGVWGKHMKSVVFRTLKENQKLNHFPGTFQIGRKDRLWRNLQRYMNKYGRREFGFMPRTYVLPQDTRTLRAIWDKQDAVRWIVKPPASARGTGIKVLNKWADIPKKVPLIVQKYISNPYLINGSKFDLRLYVLVTSFDPLRIYIYENGLVRFASARYTDDIKTLNDRFIHLTNYSINKFSNSYSSNDDASACLGHKWTLRSLWKFLGGCANIDTIWSSLVDLVIKTIICGESSISHLARTNLSSRYCCYELFGIDVLLDENLKPWLLEVNISPSLHSGSSLDTAVKGPLVTNVLNLVGYHIPDTLNPAQKSEASNKMGVRGPLTLDHRIYVMQLSPKEKDKQAYYSTIEDREMYLDEILDDLTPDDVRHLTQYEDEITQTGNFQKIFPTAETFPYHKFLEGQCYYNRLLDAWECKYSRRREEGIALLRSFCDREVHLDVSEIEPRSSISLTDLSSSQLLLTPGGIGGSSNSPSSSTAANPAAAGTTAPSDTAKKSDTLKKVPPASCSTKRVRKASGARACYQSRVYLLRSSYSRLRRTRRKSTSNQTNTHK